MSLITRGRRWAWLAVAVALGAACGAPAVDPPGSAPAAAAPTGALDARPVTVPAGLADDPFDVPRTALVPAGWSIAVWARVPKARLAAWAPDGSLLVSVPAEGEVLRLTPGPAGGAATSVLLAGLEQPHGLAFAGGDTLYVAESDQLVAYDYAAGTATGPRVVAPGLPDAKSPELGGSYAHALKSVAVGPDGAVYFSIGSTGNISAEDRAASPPRAAILRVPPGGGPAQPFAVGVRNGTGLAVAPDGSVWTAVNNRDNIGYPFDRPYGGDTRIVLRKGHPGLRGRSSGRGGGPADRRPRPGLAVLPAGPGRRPGARRHPRSTWPTRRSCGTCRPTRTAAGWTARRCRRWSRAWARTPPRWA